MSEHKTPNIGLNNWAGNERVIRQDFCDDNLIIDTNISKNKENIGTLLNLTTSKKDSLVNAVNELDGEIGNLTTLTTSKKDNLVNAMNEVKALSDKNKTDLENINTAIGKLKATYTEITLEAAKWSGQTYSLEDNYPSATYDIEIELSGNATKDIAKAWGKVIPVPSPDGKNIIKALGTVPTISIPIRVKAVKK